MSGTALDNPLVREYLRELEAAFVRLSAGQASELREQITAHITDAVPADATDEFVGTVLSRLGSPAELVAEATAGATTHAPGGTGLGGQRDAAPARPQTPSRRGRRGWRFWVTAGAIVAAVATVVAVVTVVVSRRIAAEDAPALTAGGSEAWWYSQDSAREVSTSADGADQTTVPIRSGQWQGFVIGLFNDSDMTQTVLAVLGPGVGSDLPSAFVGSLGFHGIIGISTPNAEVDEGGGVYTGVKFSLPGVIPPHQLRALRVLWLSTTCLGPGAEQGSDEIALSVRVGPVIRTEVISLTQGWYVAGPSTGRYAVGGPECP
jgi:hypothetical protein